MPLRDFDWKSTKPLKIWPFKPRYHLTMALENLSLSDLLTVDNTYVSRIRLRRELISMHSAAVTAVRPIAEGAVLELYAWIMGVYLPKRFPTMYKIVTPETRPPSDEDNGTVLRNLVTQEDISLSGIRAIEALRILGAHVDTDFLLLLPSQSDPSGAPTYHLEAFITCFPSGFSTRKKLGQSLAGIHAPVPGYAAKLEKSMDRFFANLPVGKVVKRANWSITTNDLLFSESGNHLYNDAEVTVVSNDGRKANIAHANEKTLHASSQTIGADIARQRESVNVANCRLRCERQTLHRLPESKAVLFAFKTYHYTLQEVKDANAGKELADAVEGLGKGSVPDMEYYKRGVVWGERVKAFLRE
ncbi:hypothetical protein LTR28_003696 [Elasticomyces elasticus]|nr:hypothetical protein LTR28_003696 [Elasticomyces elasticus]